MAKPLKDFKQRFAMLATPNTALGGVGQPTSRRTELLADWVELSAYFEEVEIYRHNIRDRLINAYFVKNEDDASSAVDDAWRSLIRRSRAIGSNYPFEIDREAVILKNEAEQAYLFFLMLSSPEYLSDFSLTRGGGFRNVFELVTIEAVRRMLPNWQVSWTGATAKGLKAAGDVTAYIAGLLNTKVKSNRHFESAQDGGVDFLAVLVSGDDRAAGPAFWGQCATGMDWRKKLEEPSFNRWEDAVRVVTKPVRALAVPFVFDETKWDYASISGRSWVIDRERLAKSLPSPVDAKLPALIEKWLVKEKIRLPTAA